MSQSDFGDIDPSQTSGTELANTILEPFRDALHSMHKGSSRPGYAVAGMVWVDDSSTPWQLKLFDGTDDLVLFNLDTSGNIVRLTGVVGSQSSPVTSVDASTIRESGSRVVKGPSTGTDNAVPRYDGNGHTVQNSGVIIDDNDNISGYGQKIDVKTADFTLAAADKGKTLECDQSSSNGELLVTVPANSTTALPVGYSVTLVQVNTDTVTVSPASGVTVQNNSTLSLSGQWGAATLYKRATDEWVLVGDLS